MSDGTYDSSINLSLEVDDVNDETPQITSFENTKNILDSLAAGNVQDNSLLMTSVICMSIFT